MYGDRFIIFNLNHKIDPFQLKMIISIDVINWHNVNFLLVVDFNLVGITDTQKTIKSSKYEISFNPLLSLVSDSHALKK